jgi:Fe-S-cluster-containing dehydrogenase component
MCLTACPFGIPQFGSDGKMKKCDFCLDRLEKGLNPACIDVCPTRALHGGTLDELSSLAAQKSARRLIRSTDPSFFI